MVYFSYGKGILALFLMTMGLIAVTGVYLHTFLDPSIRANINTPGYVLLPVIIEVIIADIIFMYSTQIGGKEKIFDRTNIGIVIIVAIIILFLYSIMPTAFPPAFSIFGR